MSDTLLVIPCYNEAKRLQTDAFVGALATDDGLSLLFVDDGSTDSTPQMLDELAMREPAVSVLRMSRNAGKAEAVRAGLRRALESDHAFVGYWDADLSTPLAAAFGFRQLLKEHADVDWVLGSRVRLLGRRIDRRASRHYPGRAFSTAASLVLGLPVYDTQCGAKLFRVTADLPGLLEDAFSSGWAFDVELIARLVSTVGRERAAQRIVEHPLEEWRDVPGSNVGFLAALSAFAALARIRVRYSPGH